MLDSADAGIGRVQDLPLQRHERMWRQEHNKDNEELKRKEGSSRKGDFINGKDY